MPSNTEDAFEIEFVYRSPNVSIEGIFSPLVHRFSTELQFDSVRVEDRRSSTKRSSSWNRRCVLALRSGLKNSLQIRLWRKVGKTFVRLRILQRLDVEHTTAICRDHFDGWFRVTPDEIASS